MASTAPIVQFNKTYFPAGKRPNTTEYAEALEVVGAGNAGDLALVQGNIAALETRVSELEGQSVTAPPQLTSPSQIVVSSNNQEATFTPHVWHNLPGAKFRITQVPAGATVWVAP